MKFNSNINTIDVIKKEHLKEHILEMFIDILKKLNSKGKDSKKIRQILLHYCYELTLS